MGLIPRILIEERPLKSYSKFFDSEEDPDGIDTNSFAWGPLEAT